MLHLLREINNRLYTFLHIEQMAAQKYVQNTTFYGIGKAGAIFAYKHSRTKHLANVRAAGSACA